MYIYIKLDSRILWRKNDNMSLNKCLDFKWKKGIKGKK